MPGVDRWTGAEARLLREVALRLSLRDFADRLGVPARTISKWEQVGAARVPRPHMQAMLDTALERAEPAARLRFEAALAERQVALVHPAAVVTGLAPEQAQSLESSTTSAAVSCYG